LPNKFETCNYFRKRADPALKHGLGKTATGLNKPSTGIALTVDGARNGDLSHSARPESTSSIEPPGANYLFMAKRPATSPMIAVIRSIGRYTT